MHKERNMIITDNRYQWDGMCKISKSAAHSIKDILTHAKKGGLFGIEKSVDT